MPTVGIDIISYSRVRRTGLSAKEETAGRGDGGAKATCGGLAKKRSSDPNFGGGPRPERLGQGAGTPEKFDVDLLFSRPEGQTGTSSVAPVRPVPHVRKPPEHQRFFNELKSHPAVEPPEGKRNGSEATQPSEL